MKDYLLNVLLPMMAELSAAAFTILEDSISALVNFFNDIHQKLYLFVTFSKPREHLNTLAAVLLIIFCILCVFLLLSKAKSRSRIRTRTSSQRSRFKTARSMVARIRSKKEDFNTVIRSMDGFTFEIFVLEALRAIHKDITYIDKLKLTNDGGIDGAFAYNNTWYIIQSKHYKGSVSARDIELIGLKAAQFNRSEHPFALKMRKKHKYSTVKAIFATSGNITSTGLHKAREMGVLIVHSDDIAISLRNSKPLI